MSQGRPSICARIAFTSGTDSTVGNLRGRLARVRWSSQGSSMSRTSRYRNRSADRAWFCVLAATLPSLASAERKDSISGAPMSRGWRLPFARMNRRIQPR